MKLAVVLFLLILVSGCATLEKETTTTTIIPTTIPETTTTLEPETFECEEKLTRRYYKEDGTFEEICLEPEQLGLKRCQTDQDCSEIEECKQGFCELVYSLVIDETIK